MSGEDQVPVAEAMLYEGYALYPYRASSPKNRVRFPFGGVYPPAYAHAQTGFDRCLVHTECLVRVAAGATLSVSLRCLMLGRAAADAEPRAWREAAEHRRSWQLVLEPGETAKPFSLEGTPGVLLVTGQSVGSGLVKLRVGVENRSACTLLERDLALAETFLSLNLVLRLEHGAFVSRLEPPVELQALTEGCESAGLHPVLLGRPGDTTSLLASPIILYDYPEVAAASPGDLFDATEIDEILSLRIQTLTEAEKHEIRASEPRLANLLERTDALGASELGELHGGRSKAPPAAGRFVPGMRVWLRPKRRADIFDLALAGKLATVRSIECDAEDTVYLCVTVDDDPGADLGLTGQPGHRFFFTPEELEPYAEPRGGV